MDETRRAELKRILEDRRSEILRESMAVQTDATAAPVTDSVEDADGGFWDDVAFALILMEQGTLQHISEALARLEAGTYGKCFGCGDEIEVRRLRALPFAVRCKDCDTARDIAEQRARQLSRRRTSGFLIDLF